MPLGTIDTEQQAPEALGLFEKFTIYTEFYKHIEDQPIGLFALVPKTTPSGNRPLLARIHGGAFTEGKSDGFIRPWILELALKHDAIIVTPDYRLRPEHEHADSLADIQDFWNWIATDFSALPYANDVDVTNLAVVGESADGTFTAQTALLGMTSNLRVIILQYPALDFATMLNWLETDPPWNVPESVFDDYMAKVVPGQVVTRANYGSKIPIWQSMFSHRRFVDLEKNPLFDPMKSLEVAGPLPPVFLFHGTEDTAVRVQDSVAWAEKLKRLRPDVPLNLLIREGEHSFDEGDKLDVPWLKESIGFVERFWPVQ
ncbi:Alpha/Beta hydrolase protein [Pseudomassariella vexata]|uniref:Alpha/Beta hydrolase protein n=1 Tax=Pseudomassariella vexata TaxID=1141098 RepID=A0A1Y2EAX0_9PEZI|nr:Alpha/Beta hydrolase protein [Pseudomassariella vexata]ORY68711.1 Alpha/Beta hydrolase protein [Pseudomassariella vexata]